MTTPIQFNQIHPNGRLPEYGSCEAAGADVRSVENAVLHPGQRRLISTGLECVIPDGWEIQVRPRSGLAFKQGVTVLNGPGTIDSDYTGTLGVLLINHGLDDFVVNVGDRIAQIVVQPTWRAEFSWSNGMTRRTDRAAGGFGSTGLK